MGQLVDVFVIKINPAFEDANFDEIVGHIPERYVPMFSALWNEFQSLEEIMDERHLDLIMDIAEEFNNEECDIFFMRRYRHESLYQHIRTIFFDTLLILQNQFDARKLNRCIVVNKKDMIAITLPMPRVLTDNVINVRADDLISEDKWKATIPGDQQMLQSTVEDLQEDGFTVYSDIHKGIK